MLVILPTLSNERLEKLLTNQNHDGIHFHRIPLFPCCGCRLRALRSLSMAPLSIVWLVLYLLLHMESAHGGSFALCDHAVLWLRLAPGIAAGTTICSYVDVWRSRLNGCCS